MKEHNEIQADDIRDVAKCLELGLITEERAREQVKEIQERPIWPEIQFNINWYAEVILNESGAKIWNDSIYSNLRGHRDAGHVVREQLHVLIRLFGPVMFPWETPFRPQIRLFPEESLIRVV